jgi:hypothetical protein
MSEVICTQLTEKFPPFYLVEESISVLAIASCLFASLLKTEISGPVYGRAAWSFPKEVTKVKVWICNSNSDVYVEYCRLHGVISRKILLSKG